MKVYMYFNENDKESIPHVFGTIQQLKDYLTDFTGRKWPEDFDVEDAHILKLLEAEGNHEYVGSHFWFASREVRP